MRIHKTMQLWTPSLCCTILSTISGIQRWVSETDASHWPGAVGGNAPADPLAFSLRGRGGITGAGLGGRLPARPLWRGSQPRAAGTAHITTGLLLLSEQTGRRRREHKDDNQNTQAIENDNVTAFYNHLRKIFTQSITAWSQNTKQIIFKNDETAQVNITSRQRKGLKGQKSSKRTKPE